MDPVTLAVRQFKVENNVMQSINKHDGGSVRGGPGIIEKWDA